MSSADLAGGLRLCRASAWNQLEEDWRMLIEPPGGAWLVERDARVIATAALMRYDTLAWVAMMLVDPAERRAGLGSKLLSLALAAASGTPCVGLDATPAGEPLYRRFGFNGDSALVRMKATVKAAAFGHASGGARPMEAADLPAVCRTDRDIFGADRSRLLYSLFTRAPECAWILPDRGYSFGRPGHLYGQLGPVVATDQAAARDLLTHCLSRLDSRPLAIDVPRLHPDWSAWLQSAGFMEERPFLRMFLRGHIHPGNPLRQYAICGPEFA
jgi:GNAT superfamily N-acetyltransferase